MITATGCDGVMIGRGAVLNPWIFSGRDREEIKPGEVQDLLLDHLDRSLSFYGPGERAGPLPEIRRGIPKAL